MSGGLAILLIIVVWLIVLAPWLLRSQRPMSQTGEGFDDTRVLFEGDSGKVPDRLRPQFRAEDVHAATEPRADSDYEIVDAAVDEESPLRDEASKDAEGQYVEGEIVEAVEGKTSAGSRQSGPRSHDVDLFANPNGGEELEVSGELVSDDEMELAELDDAPVASGSSAYRDEVFTAPVDYPVAEDSYPLDDSYTSPVDLLYPGAVDTRADDYEYQLSEPAGEGDAVQEEALSDEELAFAQRRTGRGGWDPVADKQASVNRYQRRQRILLGMTASVVLTVALGIIVGGWMWSVAAVAGVVVALYLVALRTQVRQEQQLRSRRIRQLRRARLGVRSIQDEELDIPRSLRRPGAVVLEADDDSPDFDYLPVHHGDGTGTDPRSYSRRPRRDDLAARRVG